MEILRVDIFPVSSRDFETHKKGTAIEAGRKQRGFTLVETLISILILSIALFSMVALITRVVALQTDLKDREGASLEAASALKEIESSFRDIEEDQWESGKYTLQLFIDGEETAKGKIAGKTVRLKVSWSGVRGERELEFIRTISATGKQTRGERMKGEEQQ